MNPIYQLKHAADFGTPGSHLRRIRISRETAQQLLKLTRDRTNRSDLRQALLDADLHDGINAAVGPVYTGAGTCVLLCDTRNRLLTELDVRVDELRQQGAA